MKSLPRIIITPGEPAGIGPDIVLKIAQQPWNAELVVVADPDLLMQRAKQLGLPITLSSLDITKPAAANSIQELKIIPIKLNAPCIAGQLNPENAAYVMKSLTIATDYCLQHQADALVTGPIHKAIMNEAGISFSGHTEFLAERSACQSVIMLFVIDQLKVALATTHLPLADVPKKITVDLLVKQLRLLHQELKNRFHISHPHILVSGLNPHAGESGHLGLEEIEIISPALNILRAENIHLTGPLPADTLFTEKNLRLADAIFAMYHDQALPVVKYLGFDRAVNVTLGLPIIRTSVDHGTALDIAGTKAANEGSLKAAILLAISLQDKK